MSGFSADWLALREPADHAARNPELLSAVGAFFAARNSVTVVDLGCGTGSNLRGTFSSLPERQHWTLVDLDERLLASARETLANWAEEAQEQGEELVMRKHGRTITVDFRKADLERDLEWVLGWQPDLVTAAALFDLASRRWLERFVAALVSQRLPLYTVLSYGGRDRWLPPHEADAAVLAAFNHHQRGDKGFGSAAGPMATEILAEAFRKAGFAVSTGDSDWVLGSGHERLREALAGGIADAAAETGHLDPARIDDWRRARIACDEAVVSHHDLWARPV